jgi:diacylglycerol kinase (ATP)
MENAPKSCRPPVDTAHHHFVEGNVPLGSSCVVCLESFEMLEFNGLRCSRCGIFVHEKFCRSTLKKKIPVCEPHHHNLMLISPDSPVIFDPNLHLQRWTASCTPLAIFINPKSGGQVGKQLKSAFSSLLSPTQVFDLVDDKGPQKGLMSFAKQTKNFRVLVCGGDGTVGWVLNSLDDLQIDRPPVYFTLILTSYRLVSYHWEPEMTLQGLLVGVMDILGKN